MDEQNEQIRGQKDSGEKNADSRKKAKPNQTNKPKNFREWMEKS